MSVMVCASQAVCSEGPPAAASAGYTASSARCSSASMLARLRSISSPAVATSALVAASAARFSSLQKKYVALLRTGRRARAWGGGRACSA